MKISSFPFFSLWTQSSLPWKCHSFAKNEPPSVFLKNFRHSLFVGIPIYIRSPVSCGGAGYCIGHPAGGLSATYGCFVAPKHLTEGSNRRGSELSILSSLSINLHPISFHVSPVQCCAIFLCCLDDEIHITDHHRKPNINRDHLVDLTTFVSGNKSLWTKVTNLTIHINGNHGVLLKL